MFFLASICRLRAGRKHILRRLLLMQLATHLKGLGNRVLDRDLGLTTAVRSC